MSGFGTTPTTTTQGTLATNQFPIAEVYVPNTASGNLTALQGGTASTDTNGNSSAPVMAQLAAGSAVVGHVIVDSAGAVSVVALPALPAGTNAIGTVGVTALPTLPAGTNVIGHVIVDSAGSVSITSLPSLPAGSNLIGGTQLVDSAGTNKASVSASGAVKVDGSATTQPVSAASLPLPTGAATSAKQPALGTAGTASTDVLSVQGITSMTPLKTDGSAVTQPVSGTFWQATQPVSISAFGLDNTNEQKVSLYGKNSVAGDTALSVDSSGYVQTHQKLGGSDISTTNPMPVNTVAQAGEVALYASNPTTLTANTDAAVKWGASGTTAVNHIEIYNGWTGSINVRLDAATTAGSAVIASGQTKTYDVAGTLACHLQANGTPNINGSSSGNIVVTGWL